MRSQQASEHVASGLRAKPLRGPRHVADGAALRAAREAAGLDQAAIADALGVCRQMVSQMETGDEALTFARIARLPRAVRLALLGPIVDADRRESPPPRMTALELNARLADNRAAVRHALAIADRRVVATESPAVREAIREERAELDALEAFYDVVDRERVVGV